MRYSESWFQHNLALGFGLTILYMFPHLQNETCDSFCLGMFVRINWIKVSQGLKIVCHMQEILYEQKVFHNSFM